MFTKQINPININCRVQHTHTNTHIHVSSFLALPRAMATTVRCIFFAFELNSRLRDRHCHAWRLPAKKKKWKRRRSKTRMLCVICQYFPYQFFMRIFFCSIWLITKLAGGGEYSLVIWKEPARKWNGKRRIHSQFPFDHTPFFSFVFSRSKCIDSPVSSCFDSKWLRICARASLFFHVRSNQSVHLVLIMRLIQIEENVIEREKKKLEFNSTVFLSLSHSLFSLGSLFFRSFFHSDWATYNSNGHSISILLRVIIISFGSFSKRFIAQSIKFRSNFPRYTHDRE